MRSVALPSVLLIAACSNAPSGAPDGGIADMSTAPPADMTGVASQSYSLKPFTLAPGAEEINCYYVPPDGKEKFISRFTTDMAPGSHHLVVFRIKDDVGMPASGPTPCSQLDLPNGFDGLLPGSQDPPHSEFRLPEGVAMKLEKNHGILFQSHYINASQKPLTTDVKWTIDTVDGSLVKEVAGLIFYSNFGLDIPVGMQKASMTCKLPQDLRLLTATGHMHKHGLTFDADIDRKAIYHTDRWDEPHNEEFPAPGMVVARGQSLTWTCAYNNDTGGRLRFGNSAATDEMCIFVGIYYPAANGQTLFFCQS